MKNKRYGLYLMVLFMSLNVMACQNGETEDENHYPIESIEIEPCEIRSTHVNDLIIPKNLIISDALVHGDIETFINPCKAKDEGPLVLSDATRPTFRMTYQLPGNYPVSHLEITNFIGDDALKISRVHIDISDSSRTYKRLKSDVELEDTTRIEINENVTHIRFVFSSIEGEGNQSGPFFGLHDVRFYLDEGFKIEKSNEFTDPFFRMSGWTGADGIFSYNLSHGRRHIGSPSDNILFIFSDTFIGEVYPHNFIRHSDVIVNSTLAYYDPSKSFFDGLKFHYATDDEANPKSIFTPESYIGFHPSNLMNGDGLDKFPYRDALLSERALGHSWRGSLNDHTLTFDFKSPQALAELVIYNDNHTPTYGVKSFNLYAGNNLDSMVFIDRYELPKASQAPSLPQKSIDLPNLTARFLRIEILDNYQSEATTYALGKVLAFDSSGNFLHAEISAEGYMEDMDALESSGLLWLQDSVIIGDYFYNFPILIKDNPDTDFKVHKVGLSKTPISDGQLDYDNAIYFDTPLQSRTEDGGEIFYGAGILDMTDHPLIDDAYIYIYGYKDLDGRHLTVARVRPEAIEDFNAYEFYDGTTFQSDIRQSHMGIQGVSAELSISYIPSGKYAEKYMLISMEDTISGRVVYSVSDTPFGPFTPFTTIYHAPEPYTLDFAFAYNAKMHPILSEENRYVISYNVNGYRTMALKNARVYYPRFIIMTEIQQD